MGLLRRYGWWITGAALVLAWGGFSWLRYSLAEQRLWDCYEYINRLTQRSICLREAIGARDSVITLAVGVPLALLIAAFAFLWAMRQVRK